MNKRSWAELFVQSSTRLSKSTHTHTFTLTGCDAIHVHTRIPIHVRTSNFPWRMPFSAGMGTALISQVLVCSAFFGSDLSLVASMDEMPQLTNYKKSI